MSHRRTASRRARLGIAIGIMTPIVVLVAVGGIVATGGLAGLGAPAGLAGSTAEPSGHGVAPSPAAGLIATPQNSPSASAPPSASAAPPTATLSWPASPGVVAAPASATGFLLRHTVVPMAFPLLAATKHDYGDRWRVPRLGEPYPYEEIRGVAPDGTLLRAHDGVDVVVATGTPVLAVFDGIVIDPATRWRPWDPSRYGTVVVIRSTESSSPGYVAIAAHLSRRAVHLGDAVRRGQVVGWTGRTGNAAGTIPHLHFELRAPFTIAQTWSGIRRLLDVFDPLPSLLAADPAANRRSGR
jgi:murein DD-endopeptidase MepM/ murein hydrolase activator NlpD